MYYRTYVAIAFDDSTSGRTIRSLLHRYKATIIGGAPYAAPNGEYIVKFPDPGGTFAALESLLVRLEAEPGVEHVSDLTFRDVVGFIGYDPAPADTTRPAIPADLNLPADSSHTVTYPGESLPIYFRNIAAIGFYDSTSGRMIRSLLQRYNGTIIGGTPYPLPDGEYIVEFPDPGPTFADWESLLVRLRAERGVEHVSPVTFREYFDPRRAPAH